MPPATRVTPAPIRARTLLCRRRACSRARWPPASRFGLRGRVHDRPRRLALAALGGLALSVALWPVVREHGHAALVAAFAPQSAANGGLGVALGHVAWCWLALAGCGPALAWLAAWLAPPTLRELEARSQRRSERRVARLAPREQPDLASAVGLGERIAGDAVLPARGRELVLPLAWLARHALVLGASGSGKTETLLRIAHEVARRSDWAVFFIDGKGDRETMRRFHALMADAGRRARLFPDEGYDGWRGSASDVAVAAGRGDRLRAGGARRLLPRPGRQPHPARLRRARRPAPQRPRAAGPPRPPDAGERVREQPAAPGGARLHAPAGRRGPRPLLRVLRRHPRPPRPRLGVRGHPAPATCCSTGCGSSTRPPASRASSSRTSRSTPSSASPATGACC